MKLVDLETAGECMKGMCGFFDRFSEQGESVMGCLQSARFQPPSVEGPPQPFSETILENFIRWSRWEWSDGEPGGFSYTPAIRKIKNSGNLELVDSDSAGHTLAEIGTSSDWIVYRVDIHDFVRSLKPLKKMSRFLSRYVRESAYVVVHPDFARPLEKAPENAVAESCFGYSFLPCVVEPNIFGFGPGHFQAAVKQFRFFLMADGGVEARLTFLVSPRSEKILNFKGFDPVYSAVDWANALFPEKLALGEKMHERLDALMLRLHGSVHHNLLVGMRERWENSAWTATSPLNGDQSPNGEVQKRAGAPVTD